MNFGNRKALIFDVDGTLAETEELHRAAYNTTFEDFGLDWHWDTALYGELLDVSGGVNRLTYFIENWQPSCAGDFIDEVAQMHARKTEIYGEMMDAGDIALRPGVADLIQAGLDAGLKLAIATATSRPNVDRLFDATMGLDVLSRFSAIACGGDVKNNKPAPDLYELALEQLSLHPCACVALEDSENGLKAALAAQIDTIVTPSAYSRQDDFTGAYACLTDLTEIDSVSF